MTPSQWVARAIATWFGCGYWPWGPGTLGAAAAIAIAVIFQAGTVEILVLAAVSTAVGIWASGVEAQTSGRKDPGHVVVDEVAGQWIALAGAGVVNWKTYAIAFLLFRLFDIWKPFPVRQAEQLPGGVGIMADDVMAGIYGALLLAAGRWLQLY